LRAAHVEVTKLHAVDLGEAELLDLAVERVGQSLDHEHQARRPRGRDLDRRIEAANGLGILEAPGVRFDRLQEHLLIGGKPGSHEHEGAFGVERDDVHGGVTQQQARVEHCETRLDSVEVLDHQRLQLPNVCDFQLFDHQSHRPLLALDLLCRGEERARGVPTPDPDHKYLILITEWICSGCRKATYPADS